MSKDAALAEGKERRRRRKSAKASDSLLIQLSFLSLLLSCCRRDPETLQITASPEAPLPKIVIYGMDGKEANTVRIGDKLTFRIQIPEATPYGIFARSCVAMAKDARSTFEIVDEHG